ncbi:MAG: peptidoglycan DD-metalloendopeptidase family protein [Deltaproteobacteria bacterium]|jgi:murein DD-endopeptidase MepM/ murein hydrolase activator NlpD|nr:peptidoglycan DD-metalloendopeptidase family protein [Deltaproteobacteria bacterium]
MYKILLPALCIALNLLFRFNTSHASAVAGNIGQAYAHEEQLFFLMPPLSYTPRVSSNFSTARLDPVKKQSVRAHCAVDFAAPTGTVILAPAAGKIVKQHEDPYKGKYVEIEHNAIYKSRYFHLSAHSKNLKIGDYVQQGDIIGYVGSTGNSTGPHLHFALARKENFIDPLAYDFKKKSGQLYNNIDIPLVAYLDKPEHDCSGSGVPAPEGAPVYYKNGTLFNPLTWDGEANLYYASGKAYLLTEKNNGERVQKIFYENGSLKALADGKTIRTYHADGKNGGAFSVKDNGALDGKYTVYTQTGQLSEEGEFFENELDGESRHYDDSGALKQANYYFSGLLTTKEQMLKLQEERRERLLQTQEDLRQSLKKSQEEIRLNHQNR